MRFFKMKLLKSFLLLLLTLVIGSVYLMAQAYFSRSNNQEVAQLGTQSVLVPTSTPYDNPAIDAHGLTPTTGNTRTPTGKPTGQPTRTSTPPQGTPPPNWNSTTTLPPGSTLPSESACASLITRSSFEPRPDNNTANHSVPTAAQIANISPWGPLIGMDAKSDSIRKQITGNFTGTTDEILQWVACKWGIDVNIVRAEAVTESHWHQSTRGDYTNDQTLCPPGTWDGQGCYQSYGILQVKYTFWKNAWPMTRDDTAFSAEFVYGWIRNCYEGWADYLYNQTPSPGYPGYHAGDIWGCVGFWFSGGWYTQGAISYIQTTQNYYNQKPWLQPGF